MSTGCLDGGTPDGGWVHVDPAGGADCDDEDAEELPGQQWYGDCDGDSAFSATAIASCLEPTGAATGCLDGGTPDGGWVHVDPRPVGPTATTKTPRSFLVSSGAGTVTVIVRSRPRR